MDHGWFNRWRQINTAITKIELLMDVRYTKSSPVGVQIRLNMLCDCSFHVEERFYGEHSSSRLVGLMKLPVKIAPTAV